jgi:hypothetical protein
MEKSDDSSGSTCMRCEKGGGAGDPSGIFFSDESGLDGGDEFVRIAGKPASIGGNELAGERLEVFHVRPEDEWLAGKDGLRWILTTGGEETFTDDHGIRMGRPVTQLAGGIDDKASIRGSGRWTEIGAKDDFETRIFEVCSHFGTALRMARDDHGKGLRICLTNGGGDP